MRFPGIIPAVTTPFDESGEIDLAGLERNLAGLLDAGVHGLVATGTMGEAGSLSVAERRTVVEAVVRAAGGRVPVVAGVSAGTPAGAIAFAADAAEAGADALMLLPPLGYRGDEHEIEAHYRSVAEATGLPLMAYNNPEASGTDMAPELLVRLYEDVDAVVAVKECSGDARRIAALLNAAPGLEVLVGGDDRAALGGREAARLPHGPGRHDPVDAGLQQRRDVARQRGFVDRAGGIERGGDGGDDSGEAHGDLSSRESCTCVRA